jgi:mono/diheme cytochrome c family protein
VRPPSRAFWKGFALWVAGGASAAVAAGAAGLYVMFGGAFDAAASTPHLPIVAWATHVTMIHSVRVRARAVIAPRAFSQAQVMAGVREYDQRCAACHGGPAQARAPWASGLTPTPPYLLDAARRWSAPELYWIVDNGVKMTAMPAWGESESRARIWDVVAFLEALPRLSPGDYAKMRGTTAPTAPDPLQASQPAPPPR